MSILAKCLRTDKVIGSDEWKRQVACDCEACQRFFKLCLDLGSTGEAYRRYKKGGDDDKNLYLCKE